VWIALVLRRLFIGYEAMRECFAAEHREEVKAWDEVRTERTNMGMVIVTCVSEIASGVHVGMKKDVRWTVHWGFFVRDPESFAVAPAQANLHFILIFEVHFR
jgi:hypothetical protein